MEMVLVTYIEVLREGDSYLFFFKTEQGVFISRISHDIAFQAHNILDGEKTLVGKLLRVKCADIQKCEIYAEERELIAQISDNENVIVGGFEEAVLLSMELHIPIFVREDLIKNDFDPDDSAHDRFMQEILLDQINTKIELSLDELMEKESKAVSEERYEEAARLRDQIRKINENAAQDIIKDQHERKNKNS